MSNNASTARRGDLGKLVKTDLQGKTLDPKMTVNSMVAQLSTLANEVTCVSLEVGTERLLGGHSCPNWKVRSIVEVTKAVAGGDLTKEINLSETCSACDRSHAGDIALRTRLLPLYEENVTL